MTPRRSPIHSQPRTPVTIARTLGRNQAHRVHRHTTAGFLLIVIFSMLARSIAMAEGTVSPILLAEVAGQQADQLASIASDEAALTLFIKTVGPALGLKDAAGTLGAKRLPGKMVKELGLAELSNSVYELMAALSAWQFADSLGHDVGQSSSGTPLPASARQDWLTNRSRVDSLPDLFRLSQEAQTLRTSATTPMQQNSDLPLAALRTVFDSSQQATAAWWEIYGWKERVRQAKGRARLCGTWQWVIHNHQHHEEQKHTLVFPPDGPMSATIPALSEMIMLGDGIYLRWEHNGQIQEDSLLFTKDNTKLEGSFVNSMGGWGAISGKRTAPCRP